MADDEELKVPLPKKADEGDGVCRSICTVWWSWCDIDGTTIGSKV